MEEQDDKSLDSNRPTEALPVQAQTFEIGPGGVKVYPRGGGDCRELRAACMHKEEMGETGMGNCRRYREMCTGGARGYYHPHRYMHEQD